MAAIVVALAGALGLGVSGQAIAASGAERVRALEIRYEGLDKRLERMEGKIDRLLEKGR